MHDVPGRPTGMSRPAASAPASASSAGRRRPTTTSWSRKASRCSATSASARCRTCRWRRGSAPAAAAATSSSTAPKANGAATSSRCRAPARSIPRSTSTRRSISSSKAAAPPRSGSTATTSATCSNGRRARCSRSRSTPWHRIVNASSAPALLLAGTTAPNLMNLINNVGAIFDCPYQFRDRFSGADDFYKYKDDIEPDPVRGLAMRRTNFVPDIVNCDLPLDNRRSPGFRRVEPFMTGNTFYLWIGQHENGRYSKAHAHTSAAVLDLHQGQGLHLHLAGAARRQSVEGRQARPGQARRLRAGRHGVGGARRRALVPPALRRLEGAAAADRMVRPAQSRPRARPARRAAHRLHRHGHPRGRQRHPVLDGRSVSSRRSTTSGSSARASRTACGRSITTRTTRASCRRSRRHHSRRQDVACSKHHNNPQHDRSIGRNSPCVSSRSKSISRFRPWSARSIQAPSAAAASRPRDAARGRRRTRWSCCPRSARSASSRWTRPASPMQVLSNSGPGPDLVPGADGVAMAREMNDHLAAAVAKHPDALRRLRRAADGKPRCLRRRARARA